MDRKLYFTQFLAGLLFFFSPAVCVANAGTSSTGVSDVWLENKLEPPYTPELMIYDQRQLYVWWYVHAERGSVTEIYRSNTAESGFVMIGTATDEDNERYLDEGLRPRTVYYYKARSLKNGEYSAFSETEMTMSESEWFEPVLTAHAIDEHTIELRLTDNSYQDYSYTVYGDDIYDGLAMSDSGRTAVFTVTGLQPGTTYTYNVDVVLNEESGTSYENVASASATTAGRPPDIATWYVDQNIVSLYITNGNSASTTEIYRSRSRDAGYELIGTLPGEASDYTDDNLNVRTTYYYKVRSEENGVYSAYSTPLELTTFSINYNPTLTATATSATSVTLTFTDNSANDKLYQIFGTSPSRNDFFEELSMPDSGRTVTIVHHPVSPGTTYSYTVYLTTYGDEEPFYDDVAQDTVTTPGTGPCEGLGSIAREVWRNVPGTDVSAIPVNSPPSEVTVLTSFETPSNNGTDYGSRVRGFICPPATGQYIFWIASDDKSELWISWNESPVNRRKIASVTGHTAIRQWDKYATQKSAPVTLQQGERYYIEALHKEASGGDHLSVGWQLPDGTQERPMPGSRLIRFEPVAPTCAEDAGQVLSREIWRNIPGTSISSIPFNTSPDNIVSMTGFETSTYYANDYGSRARAQVCVPQTGSYVFWISSDDNSELWLSTNDSPTGKVKIASVTGATRVREWTKFITQQSAPVQLQAGYRYYIEVLHKEANGNDHFAVGWQLPDDVMERPIPVNRLINYQDPNELAGRQDAAVASTQDTPGVEELMLSPNPVVNREVNLKVIGNLGGSLNEAKVQVIAFTGEVVHTETVHCDDGCRDVKLALQSKVKPGVYLVNVLKGGKRLSRKLVVE